MIKKVGIVIPLKSKRVSDNWTVTSTLLDQTLTSIRKQINLNIEVVVCCHEFPLVSDSNIAFCTMLECTLSLPVLNPEAKITHYKQIDYILDKTRKVCIGLQYLEKKNVEYYFVLDADDLIHKDLLSYVLKEQNPNGYIIKKGFELFVNKNLYVDKDNMDRICGSTAIIHKQHVQIPKEIIDTELWKNPWGRSSHGDIEEWFMKNNTPLKQIHFHALLYKLNHGQNASDEFRLGFKYKFKQWLKLAILGKRLNTQIQSNFSMDSVT